MRSRIQANNMAFLFLSMQVIRGSAFRTLNSSFLRRNLTPFITAISTTRACSERNISSSSASSYLASAIGTQLDPIELDTSKTNGNGNSNVSQTSRDMQEVICTIEMAARRAGVIMKETSGKIAVQKTKMNAADLVTESDVECQRIIRETIQSAFPNDDFLGEEDVDAGSLASSSALRSAISASTCSKRDRGENVDDNDNQENLDGKLLFIVDPIDGTTNFQAGLPMFCVSIGVVSLENNNNNQPVVVAGVIYNPILDEMVSAVRSRGCYLNGVRLKPKLGPSDLKQAVINVGFPVSSEATLKASSSAVAALATSVRGLRMIASASQVMSWVAQGKLSAYVSWDLNAWDVAAGMVIVEESGGYISNFDGTQADISSRDLIVTCKEAKGKTQLTQDIRKILEEKGCLEY